MSTFLNVFCSLTLLAIAVLEFLSFCVSHGYVQTFKTIHAIFSTIFQESLQNLKLCIRREYSYINTPSFIQMYVLGHLPVLQCNMISSLGQYPGLSNLVSFIRVMQHFQNKFLFLSYPNTSLTSSKS